VDTSPHPIPLPASGEREHRGASWDLNLTPMGGDPGVARGPRSGRVEAPVVPCQLILYILCEASTDRGLQVIAIDLDALKS